MKNQIFILAITFFVTSLVAQQKGVSSLSTINQQLSTKTYAVVVGISDYQDPSIPDLRFADKDAEAFANYLRSNAGGNLDNDHLKVLINEKATVAQFAITLDWLMEVAKENDQVIIYFSGHGDVEKRTVSQPGYLLCWDAPARVYLSGGALALPMFQDIITTLSTQNKSKVIVITDACRSGKLAGSSVGGSQITGANLAKQYANEIKILSCQPNEYSIEGEQWGGGRGAFSYNLVNALYGLADGNNDLSISLKEVGRYLDDHVSAEVAPVSQNPQVIGNPGEILALVDAKILAALRSGNTNQMAMLSPIENKGMEEDVLAGVDTTTRKLYDLFKKALKDKVFLEPVSACAEAYYEQLIAVPKLARLHSTLRRNYAAALQDDAQQTLKEWLNTEDIDKETFAGVGNAHLPVKVFKEKLRSFPRCLDRAAELLGNHHYMYSTLKARKYFFEGYLLSSSNRNPNKELGERALALFRQSLEWQADQPQVYWQMSLVYGCNLMQPDSLEYFARRAIELYPNWITPYAWTAWCLSKKYMQQDKARLLLEQASRIDSNSTFVLSIWAIFNFGQKNFTEAELELKKAITLDSTLASLWLHLADCYLYTSRYADAESVLKKAIALDSTNAFAWNNLGFAYNGAHRFVEAEPVLKKALSMDSTSQGTWGNLGIAYLNTGRYAEAEQVWKKAITLDSTSVNNRLYLFDCYFHTSRYVEAESVLKKVIALDSTTGFVWSNLGVVYLRTQRYTEGESPFKKAIALDSAAAQPRKGLGMVYFKTNRPEAARQNFLKAIALNPDYAGAILGMAYLLFSEGKTAEALGYVEQAIGKGATMEQLEKDEDLAALRMQKEKWWALMKKYFADKVYYNLACEHSLKGKLDMAFESLELSLTNGWKDYDWMQKDTDLAPLRAQTEKWNALMKKYFPLAPLGDKIK